MGSALRPRTFLRFPRQLISLLRNSFLLKCYNVVMQDGISAIATESIDDDCRSTDVITVHV